MSAENFNPVYFLSPLIPIIFSFALLFYWRARRSFRGIVLLYGLIAYASAIAIKTVFQDFTAAQVVGNFGSASVITGLYYGLQTSFLEVGLAYLFAVYAIRRGVFKDYDAESYGLSLSFWENGALLGILSFVNLLSSYLLIAYGGGDISSTLSSELQQANPGLFSSTLAALPTIGLGGLERTSSLLAHFSWGFLVLVSAYTRKPVYFLIALPMGLIDALVPFAGTMGILMFELTVFVLSILFLFIALYVKRKEHVPVKPTVVKTGEN